MTAKQGLVGDVGDIVVGSAGMMLEPLRAFVRPGWVGSKRGGDEHDASELAQAMDSFDGVGVRGQRADEVWLCEDIMGDGP